ncbi:MAG: DUF599 family protein [Candidatus Methylophosphatis roskildensis]
MPNIPAIDLLVLAWFVSCWAGYALFAKRRARRTASLVVAMRIYRRQWFRNMLAHENRIGDIGGMNALLSAATFFASSSMLILGGLVALLGAPERAIDIVADLPFTHRDSEAIWRIKIITLIVIFVYGFFKFSWSIRQFNFCAILIGAAPRTDNPDEHDDFVGTMTSVASFASEHFNQGLRAFYFALAALAWFLNPWLFVLASALVVFVLYRREFHSPTLYALTRPSSITQALHLPEHVLDELRRGARKVDEG